MSDDWQPILNRWSSAGLIDASTAESIRAWEEQHGERPGRNRFAVVAFGLGGLLLIAGVLLFVASNWQQISPTARLLLVTAAVGVFHVAGALTRDPKPALGTTLHAVGTGALGGGIFLSGQTFHLAENWPEGFLLWAIGSAVGLYFLRDWPHVLFTAVLVPLWILFEWAKLTSFEQADQMARPAAAFLVLIAAAYLTAAPPSDRSTWRKVLARLGALAVIPAAILLGAVSTFAEGTDSADGSGVALALAWLFAAGLPLGLAYALRRREAVFMLGALLWVLAILPLDAQSDQQFLALLVLYAIGSVGIVLWGLRDRHPLLVNVGVIGFALSVLAFYFATNLFNKLGRSLGLIGAGLLFIGGGWFLERTRRSIIRKIDEETP
jgi:uncharacterized membrane protein